MRRLFPILILLVIMITPFILYSSSYSSDKLVFLLTTDIHSQIYPQQRDGGLVGGLPVLSGVVNEFRNTYGDDAVVWIDRGDSIIGDPVVDMHYGLPIIEAFNLIGLDVMVIDNHELDLGLENLFRMYRYADFPMISANVFYINGSPVLPRYVVIERMGIKIGITGGTTPSPRIIYTDLINVTNTESELPNLEESINQLMSMGVDMIVVITHASLKSIRSLVKKYPLVKLVYKVGEDILVEDGTLFVGVGGSSRSMAVATFEITSDGVKPLPNESYVVEVRSPPYSVDDRIIELADYYRLPLNYFLGMPVTILDKGLGRTELCMLMAQALRNISGADFGLYNKGGVRSVLGEGLITRYDVYKVYPWWHEGIYVVEVPGWYIKDVAGSNAYAVYPSDEVDSIVDDQYYSIAITAYHFVGGDGLKFREYSVNWSYIDIPYAEAFISMYLDENATGYEALLAELNRVKQEYQELSLRLASLESQLISEEERAESLFYENLDLKKDLSEANWYNEMYLYTIFTETIVMLLLLAYIIRVRKRGGE